MARLDMSPLCAYGGEPCNFAGPQRTGCLSGPQRDPKEPPLPSFFNRGNSLPCITAKDGAGRRRSCDQTMLTVARGATVTADECASEVKEESDYVRNFDFFGVISVTTYRSYSPFPRC